MNRIRLHNIYYSLGIYPNIKGRHFLLPMYEMMKVLDRAGIRTRVLRASAELTGRGCGYTLEVAERNYAAAIRRLQDAQVEPVKIVRR